MKSDRVALLMVLAVVLLMLVTFGRFARIEQQMTRQTLMELNQKMDGFAVFLEDQGGRMGIYAEDLRRVQERLDALEAERNELLARVSQLSQNLDDMRSSPGTVELGAIAVKKSDKKKR